MLLTEHGFEERTPIRQRTVQRFQAWRYVAISAESTCFLIVRDTTGSSFASGARAQLCASGAELLDSLDRLGGGEHSVYWLDFSEEGEPCCHLSSVVALFRYTKEGAMWFDFLSEDGIVRSCADQQPAPADDSGWVMVWAAW